MAIKYRLRQRQNVSGDGRTGSELKPPAFRTPVLSSRSRKRSPKQWAELRTGADGRLKRSVCLVGENFDVLCRPHWVYRNTVTAVWSVQLKKSVYTSLVQT